MINKIKKKLIINKSLYEDKYILFLHNETKHGDGWKRLFKGTRKECINYRKQLENEKEI